MCFASKQRIVLPNLELKTDGASWQHRLQLQGQHIIDALDPHSSWLRPSLLTNRVTIVATRSEVEGRYRKAEMTQSFSTSESGSSSVLRRVVHIGEACRASSPSRLLKYGSLSSTRMHPSIASMQHGPLHAGLNVPSVGNA